MDVSDAEILDACKEVQLLDVINRKQDGLDAVIGEGGLGLSGGERQRIALARAFLRKGQVLILDEVTAHLDVKTEAIISTAIQRLMENKVVIIIGHRLQTMHWASKLYVLKNGSILQEGSYHDLLEEEGYFKDLVTSGLGQFSATLEEPLDIGKQFDSENTLVIDKPINGTEHFVKSVKYTEAFKDNAKGSKYELTRLEVVVFCIESR